MNASFSAPRRTGMTHSVDLVRVLRITGCKDPLMWYADKVGQHVPYVGRWPEAYVSREPSGYINRVEFSDAHTELVTIWEAKTSMDVENEIKQRYGLIRDTFEFKVGGWNVPRFCYQLDYENGTVTLTRIGRFVFKLMYWFAPKGDVVADFTYRR